MNLNFTAGREAMASATAQCGLRTVVTSKAFVAKAKIEPIEGSIFLEDVMAGMSTAQKARAWLLARLMPARLLASHYARQKETPDSVATVIFSSGSTGVPKGVMLSHYNVISNIEAIAQIFWISERDRIVGVLPFFHSFGFTVTLWFPLISGCGVVYHANPTDARIVGSMIAKYQGTFLLSTPTFCGNYVRKCSVEEFASLRFVLVGAEKLREPVAAAFQEKFGLRPLEGYGCTEMSPVVAVNVPDFVAGKDTQAGAKAGTVGHPLPGVAVKVVDRVTRAPLPPNEEGLLLVKGANRMTGYLGQPELSREVIHEGWYVTGDIAAVDDEGFIRITDRLSRFSKIGGEMVPHLRVEEAISSLLGDQSCVVTGVPDMQRGERLVALYVHAEMTPADLWQRISQSDLPPLWAPKRDDIHRVDSLPTLGTGKMDLRAVKAEALRLSGADRSA